MVQLHHASHIHYDFRLEMEGVLKSWAVPKGPSLDPSIKRLAMMVEDHPYDYRLFEGIIPKGQYGGGTVIVWDEGTYEGLGVEGKSKKEQEKFLLKGLHSGNLKIVLNGEKLKGEFALVKVNTFGENGWLLIKHGDKYASKIDISKKNKSVLSGLSINKVAKNADHVWESNRAEKSKVTEKKSKAKSDTGEKSKTERLVIEEGEEANFPKVFKQMLATLVN